MMCIADLTYRTVKNIGHFACESDFLLLEVILVFHVGYRAYIKLIVKADCTMDLRTCSWA